MDDAVTHEAKKTATNDAPIPSLFRYLPTLNINGIDYFHSIKTCKEACCNCSELCCFPTSTFKAAAPNAVSQLRLRHECCLFPCCYNVWVHDHNETKLSSFQTPQCCCENAFLFDCPLTTCCYSGPVMLGKFVDPEKNIRFVLKRDQSCCEGITCCCYNGGCFGSCCSCCGEQQYRVHRQPIYKQLADGSPVAYFRYVSRWPCCSLSPQRIAISIEQATPLSDTEIYQLSIFMLMTTEFALWDLGCGPALNFYNSAPMPTGYPGLDAFNGISTMIMTEEQARGYISNMA